jgi:signal transduction histidine kinase
VRAISLKLRLALAGFVALILALALAGVGLTYLFERHVYRTVSDELDAYVSQIAGGLTIDAAGNAHIDRKPNDPAFEAPDSGLYWEVIFRGETQRSRSLGGVTLVLPTDELSKGQTHYHQIIGPDGKLLLVAERRIEIGAGGSLEYARVVVASDLTRMRQARDSFARELAPSLALLGLVLTLATWAQLTIGLRPLLHLRRELAIVRRGDARRISEETPLEVRALVKELNQLLAGQEAEIARARGRAADLAHGLKTPLAALAGDARLVREAGRSDIADSMDLTGELMRRHIERELARARIRSSAIEHHPRVSIRETVDALVRTLSRTERGASVAYENLAAVDARAPFERGDLLEVLGNLLENATRHARERVRTTTQTRGGEIVIIVEDDGPGIDPAMDEFIRLRGWRLDHTGGAGLGLAIVQDILDAYGWRMEFARSDLGGLRVRLSRDADETTLVAPEGSARGARN